MAENYKHLYEQMKKLVAMYQDDIVPGLREYISKLESSREEMRESLVEYVYSGKRAKWVTHTRHGVSWTECPVCHVCGSPQWKCCPVCKTKMDEKSDNNLLFADMEEIIDATD